MPDFTQTTQTQTHFLPAWCQLLVLFLIGVSVVLMIISRFKVIQGKSVAIVEYFGKPIEKPLRPGLHFLLPFHRIRFNIDLRQRQIEKQSSVKTKDDAFIDIQWVLRFSVKDDDNSIMSFGYKVETPVERLVFKVENEIRTIISGMTMEEIYSQRDVIAQQVMQDQANEALETGLWIDGVVIEQPLPPKEVQDAMNNQIAAIARQKAAKAEAEATRVTRVGVAQAESESKALQGEGIAKERQAIVDGFAESVDTLKKSCPTVSEQSIMDLLLFTMQTDMVTTASQSGKSTIIFVPTTMKTGVNELAQNMMAKDVLDSVR